MAGGAKMRELIIDNDSPDEMLTMSGNHESLDLWLESGGEPTYIELAPESEAKLREFLNERENERANK